MQYQKLDPSLLSRIQKVTPGEYLSVYVRMDTPSQDEADKLQQMGLYANSGVTADLNMRQIESLSELECVNQIILAKPLRMS